MIYVDGSFSFQVVAVLVRCLKYKELLRVIGTLTVNEILGDNHVNVIVERLLSIKDSKDDFATPAQVYVLIFCSVLNKQFLCCFDM